MCDHCHSTHSEFEYVDRQTVCGCGHLIISRSHVLPVKRRLVKKQTVDTYHAWIARLLPKKRNTDRTKLEQAREQHQHLPKQPEAVVCRRRRCRTFKFPALVGSSPSGSENQHQSSCASDWLCNAEVVGFHGSRKSIGVSIDSPSSPCKALVQSPKRHINDDVHVNHRRCSVHRLWRGGA